MTDSLIDIIIEGDSDEIGAGEVGKVLKGIQDTVYDIGEYVFSGTYRKSGRRDPIIQKRTKLYFEKVEKGSFSAALKGEDQTTIYGKTLIEESVGLVGEIFVNLNSLPSDEIGEIISKKIDDPLQTSRILNDILDFWPGGDNSYELEVNTYEHKIGRLDKEKKASISKLAKVDTITKLEKTFGVLSAVRYVPDQTFEIRGPDGNIKCKYIDKHRDKIESMKEKPVFVLGDVKVDQAGNIKEIVEIDDIRLMDKIELSRILTDEGELDLKEPTIAEVDFENNTWIFSNPILNIIASGKKYDEALSSFQEHFYYLYETYYLGDPDNMEGHALKIREYISTLLGADK